MTVPRVTIIVGVLLSLMWVGVLAHFGPLMYPFREAAPSRFWEDITEGNGSAIVIGDRVYYCWSAGPRSMSLHGSALRSVPLAALLRDWPAEQSGLRARAAARPDDYKAAAFVAWSALPAAKQGGLPGFFKAMDDAEVVRLRSLGVSTASLLDEWLDMRRAAAKAPHYWLNYALEWALFTGLTWWLLWPALWRRGIAHWMAHLAAAPWLLLLPFWLGYGTFGPTRWQQEGGVFYPWVLWITRVELCSHLPQSDHQFVLKCPAPLEVLNQGHTWLRDPRPISRSPVVRIPGSEPLPGPIAAATLSGLLSTMVLTPLALRRLVSRLPVDRRRGFEVITANTNPESAAPAPAPSTAEFPAPDR